MLIVNMASGCVITAEINSDLKVMSQREANLLALDSLREVQELLHSPSREEVVEYLLDSILGFLQV